MRRKKKKVGMYLQIAKGAQIGLSFNCILFHYISLVLILSVWIYILLGRTWSSFPNRFLLGEKCFLILKKKKKNAAESEEILMLAQNQLPFIFCYQYLSNIILDISDWLSIWPILQWCIIHICIISALSDTTAVVFS